MAYDGYSNVHLSVEDLGTLVAQGDIGQNELTGESVDYNLGAVSDASIFGSAKFAERVNGETLFTIALEGTTVGNAHACPYSHGISCRCSGSHYHFVARSNRLTGMLAKT
ncbi:MAG TPA: hypothetical protein ENH60_11300 [Pricia sp.]|uniref:Uncharacterized protein n=1 Tax=Pricia antarctica TaxID=641691 RepID=A0A831QQT8_9FLAO|nr:hypothetical protein [Pricia sp.]HEA22970.1 hypothetical protein [Pricia antarctica]